MTTRPWRVAAHALALVGVIVAGAVGASSAVGATEPPSVRACIERNLIRYSDPASAVVVQYADIEAQCRAAIDGNGITSSFTPAGGAGATGSGSTGDGTTGTGGSSSPASGGTAGTGPTSDGTGSAPGASGAPSNGSAGAAPRRGASASAAVSAAAAGEASSTAAVAVPAGDSPWWMILLGAALAALVAGGAFVTLRQRRR